MSRVQRSVLFASVVAIFAVVLLARSTAALVGEGQTPVPAPADVTPFVGDDHAEYMTYLRDRYLSRVVDS